MQHELDLNIIDDAVKASLAKVELGRGGVYPAAWDLGNLTDPRALYLMFKLQMPPLNEGGLSCQGMAIASL